MFKKLLFLFSTISILLVLLSASCNSVQGNAQSQDGQSTEKTENASQDFILENAKELTVVFYNVENLFDIYDDPKTNDNQFLPSSEKEWSAERYSKKLKDLSKVINALSDEAQDEADIIGLVEIENRAVIEDLIKEGELAKTNYKIVHEESPDERGIDVGLVYNSDVFQYVSHESLRVYFEESPQVKTRDILYVNGLVNGQSMHVFVNHWSSRRSGQQESEYKRLACAEVAKKKIEEIQKEDENANILLMGDFNDYPDNKSIVEVIEADNSSEKHHFFNTALKAHKNDEGTYNYRGDWGMLDQIIISNEMLDSKTFELSSKDISIFKPEWLLYHNKKYNDWRPNKTYGGPKYYGGYSDHLPVYVQFNLNF